MGSTNDRLKKKPHILKKEDESEEDKWDLLENGQMGSTNDRLKNGWCQMHKNFQLKKGYINFIFKCRRLQCSDRC
jgi:hypothetical protein